VTLQIPLSLEVKLNLINKWGPEALLICECGERPSHTMWFQYGPGKCPICKQTCQMIIQDWSVIQDGP
jgi:hypothetical protein